MIQPALNLVQLVGGELEALPLFRHSVGNVVDLAIGALQTLIQGGKALVQMAHRAQRLLCPPQQVQHTVAVIAAIEGIVRPGHGGNKLLGIAQQIAAALQFFLLAGFQLGPLQFRDLVLQRIHPAGLLRLIHLQGVHLTPDLCQGIILFSICIP